MRLGSLAAAAIATMALVITIPVNTYAETGYSADLDGLQEVGPNASPGTGHATVVLNNAQDMIHVHMEFSGLQGTQTAAHIHGAATAGVNAGVVFGLTGANADYAGPVMAGPIAIGNSYMLYGANKAAGPSLADQINAQPSMYYVNLHTSAFPGGEIRGQLAPVPEASTYAMMLGGLGLVGFMAARRRRTA